MKWKLIVVILIAVLLISGCILTEALALKQKPGESDPAYTERQAAAQARVDAWVAMGMSLLGILWPAGVGAVATGAVLIRKYRHWHNLLVTVIRAVERAETEKDASPVKRMVEGLDNAALNKAVYDETH